MGFAFFALALPVQAQVPIPTVVTQVASGFLHSCALTTSGTVWCWGRNTEGQLGDGTNTDRASPVQVPGLSNVVAIAAYGEASGEFTGGHTCALTQAGTMKCWGSNNYGQLGLGTTGGSVNTPGDVPGLSNVAAIALGARHSCALTALGSMRCWGANNKGQIGHNADSTQTNPQPSPTQVLGLGSGVIAIAAGFLNSCAILVDGTLKCWGYNDWGQVGDGTVGGGATTSKHSPQTVAGLGGPATAVAVGSDHICAVVGGGAKCWGRNSQEQLGGTIPSPPTTHSTSPIGVFGLSSGVARLSAGHQSACAVTTAGLAKCWGLNSNGQAGRGAVTSTRPLTTDPFGGDVSGLSSGVVDISIAYQHACAVTIDGSVRCWGGNADGRVGNGATLPGADVVVPVPPTGLTSAIAASAVATGWQHSCARTTSGGAMCWGRNVEGQLGNGATLPGPATVSVPVTVSGLANVVSLGVGAAHSCALTTDNAVKCWGANSHGQLGVAGGNSAVPLDVTGLSANVSALAVGERHACALVSGTVKCWGDNTRGQLGNNVEGGSSSTPVDVHTASGDTTPLAATGVAVGHSHSCALILGGGAKCWGRNDFGQLGNNDTSGNTAGGNVLTAVAVQGTVGIITAIVGGAEHGCALVGSNVRCWGRGNSGQLGGGSFADSLVAVTVRDTNVPQNMVDAIGLEAGASHTCATLSNSQIKCWGLNDRGQLGDGTLTNAELTRAVRGYSADSGVGVLSAGSQTTCAVTSANVVRCWGANSDGQVGDSTLTDRPSAAEALLGTQSLAFPAPASLKYATPASLSAPALSGLAAEFDSWTPATCNVTGTTVNPTELGVCGLRAKQAGNAAFRAAPQQLRLIPVGKADQDIVIAAIATQAFGNSIPLSTTQSGGSGNPVTFSSLTTPVCTVSGTTATMVGVGTCTIAADQAGATRYNAGHAELGFTVTKANQSIGFGAAPSPAYAPGSQFSVSPAATSGLPVTISVPLTASVCTVASGHTLNIVGAGTCTVEAQQPGNANYNAAPPATQSVTIAKAAQTPVFGAVGAKTFGDPPFGVTATGGGSGNVVVISVLTPATCGLSGANVTINSAGACVLAADQAGNANYQAGHAELTIPVAKAGQAITGFGTPANRTFGAAAFSVAAGVAGGGSGNPVYFVVPATTSVCTTTLAGLVSLVGAGTCTVEARQDGNGNYLAAPAVSRSFTVNKASQAIVGFANPGPKVFGSAPFTVAMGVTGGASGNPVQFTSTTTAVCTSTAAGTVTIVRAGTCRIEARQGGSANYEAAPVVAQSFAVNAIAPTAPVIGLATPGNGQATIHFTAPSNDGGANITTFNVTCNPGANPGSAGASPVVVNGLTNGVTYTCSVTATNAAGLTGPASATVSVTPRVLQLVFNPASLDFGGQSMGTTAPARAVTVTNDTLSSVTVTSVSAGAQFPLTHNCTTLAPQQACTVQVAFLPANASLPLAQSTPVAGTLSVADNVSGSPHTMPLAGSAEKSLVTHYYRSILRRAPDAGGKAFWDGEAQRVAGLGANVNETWFAMAQAFYFSAEYAAFNRNNAGFATDLYNTFFNRAPDPGGLAFWVANLDQGMPREVALASFMFSAEFANFTQAIFGSTAARAEVNAIVDFYRGLLARTPDSGGFNFWVGRFRAAQCQDAAAVTKEVEAISSAFATSAEYAGRNRTDAQYTGDLYNAFLRRGGDLGGVQFWIGTLSRATNPLTREQLRIEFKNSAEFQARVAAIIAQGCLGS